MAAFRTMMWGDLPPAGNPISLVRNGELPEFSGYVPQWVGTGTMALAMAMIAAWGQRPHIVQPEVILPGYGCPDLIAAAEFAGLRAVLVDIGSEDPGYNIASLEAALTSSTVAVVAVNFLGIKDRLDDLRSLIGPSIALVEDNAQWFPEPLNDLKGDFVCLSFGRGKPVSLLGGGALLIRQPFAERVTSLLSVEQSAGPGWGYALQVAAYNLLLCPHAYGLLSRNPWLKLGQTRYKPLTTLRVMEQQRQSLLAENVRSYLERGRCIQNRLREIISRNSQLTDIAVNAGERAGRLLRYPILCRDATHRDQLWAALRAEGLGATAMYQQTLPEILSVVNRGIVAGRLNGAKAFAQRLLTLPTHSGVSEKHLEQISNTLARS